MVNQLQNGLVQNAILAGKHDLEYVFHFKVNNMPLSILNGMASLF